MILLHRLRAQNFKQLTDVTLDFPRNGTVLIEGENEAGKSCLFEAVFFALYGETLIQDRDYRLEHLRTYGSDELRVELEFSIEGRPFTIARRIGKNQTVRLTCPTGDGTESITGSREVSRRLEAELRLSPDALLNTCFVEQKRLERLEELDPRVRRETMNELLNLRVLTSLEAEFKVTQEDRTSIQTQRARVAIARLDDQLPALQASVQAATRSLAYVRLLQATARLEGLQVEIQTAEREQRQVQREREELASALDECNLLRSRIQAIEQELTLRASAWAESQRVCEQEAAKVATLEALGAGLPARAALLREQAAHLEQLRSLEALEGEAADLEGQLRQTDDALARWDTVEEEWEEGEARRAVLEWQRQTAEAEVRQAEADLEGRRAARTRDGNLALLLQHLGAWEKATADARGLSSRLDASHATASDLAARRERVDRLEAVEARLRQLTEDRRALALVEEDLSRQRALQDEHARGVQAVGQLEGQIADLRDRAEEADAAEQTARGALQAAQRRRALEEWAEAAELAAEADPVAGKSAEAEGRLQAAQNRRADAEQHVQQARRQVVPGLVVAGIGLLAGVAAVVTHLLLPLGILALALLAVGAGLAARGQQATAKGRAALAAAQSECDQLEGESRAVARQAEASAAQRQQRAAREEECRQRLLGLSGQLPASPAVARAEAASLLPAGVADAEVAVRDTTGIAARARAALEGAEESLKRARAEAGRIDSVAVAAEIDRLGTERGRIEAAIQTAADVPQALRELAGEASPEAVQRALAAARRVVAEAESAARDLPDLEWQRDDKQQLAAAESEQVQAIVAALSLAGDDPAQWRALAQSARAVLQEEATVRPDTDLAAAVQQARLAMDDTRSRITALETEQRVRGDDLAAKSRPDLEAERDVARAAVEANAAAQTPLRPVRQVLAAAGLPTQAVSLGEHRARESARFERDQAEAEGLPVARQEQEARVSALATQGDEFHEAWKRTLADEPPATTLSDALSRLPGLRLRAEADLARRDEPGLIAEDQRLQRRTTELAAAIATSRQGQESWETERRALLTELNAAPGEAAEALLQRFPELAEAGTRDAVGWQAALEARQEAVRENRIDRRNRAEALRIGDAPMQLAAEQDALAEAEKTVAIKQRAGVIVAKTRQSIVNRVMPLTMQNMRQLLPLLTAGRYQDAKWDEDTNTIWVYDNRARDYQRKRVFSGGARDQISLALRLAFALATLPGEYNVRPGWLFLDEPLSSFDRNRTQALVDLVTRGLVRKQFPQIFLISHSESVDSAQFDHYLRMREGEIGDTRLPQETRAAA